VSPPVPRVLVVDDDAVKALSALDSEHPALVLLDVRMPGLSGMDTLRRLRAAWADVPILMLTAHADIAEAVQATRLGADDFLTRPIQNADLVHTVRRTLERRALEAEVKDLRSRLQAGGALALLAGVSAGMGLVTRQIEQVAGSAYTVLIQGETGTGKELVARAIHQQSPRRSKAFVPVDCGAIPEGLVEAELFGHEKGAFTGAERRRPGRFQLAEGGTVFLDEVGNLALAPQAKLLRSIEEREVQSLGGARPVAVDVRFVAATNESLEERVAGGLFRSDLYYRLAELTIVLPPLRERREDVPLLARRFLEEAGLELRRSLAGLSEGALDLLSAQTWPGNVRELRNVVRQAALQIEGPIIGADALQALLELRRRGPTPTVGPTKGLALREVTENATRDAETVAIAAALRSAHGNKTRAAALLQVDFKTLHGKMKRYGLGTGTTNDDPS
jgi:DNA-binding NtrC family response regulator